MKNSRQINENAYQQERGELPLGFFVAYDQGKRVGMRKSKEELIAEIREKGH